MGRPRPGDGRRDAAGLADQPPRRAARRAGDHRLAGGEPTLRGLDFFRDAVALAEELKRPRQQVQHAIQTNATLIDDAWGAFLAEHRFLVGVSLDGPAPLHDLYRVNRAGRGTHAQVVRGLRVLQAHGVEHNILCTVHAGNAAHPLEVYRHFRDDLGAEFIQFIPIVERVEPGQEAVAEAGYRDDAGRHVLYRQRGTGVTSRTVDPAAYGAFLNAIFDEWVSRDVGSVFIQDVDVALGALFGRYSLCVHAPTCGDALAMEHNGDVYSCDHFVEPDHRLGNVATDSFADMLNQPFQREFGRSKATALPAQCLACPVRWACHGGCPKDRFATTASGEPGLNYLCAGYEAFYTHITPALRAMGDLLRQGRPAADIMGAAPRG
ncbi:anaerobic sulfatase maturase [Propioniciclava coleopterorum]|uniref:anaerobic sulfatase maturase n=1 Tax=Propioniciclava coleopterorum TaxID=2714937 RepID=UPI00197DD80B|nr:anaerobic sulfatase maturase [Propioniciclava coleopterorum]